MRATRSGMKAFVVLLACLAMPAAADTQQPAVCRAWLGCHRQHGNDRKPCPECGKGQIPAEDAVCYSCAAKKNLCRHCGLPRSSGGGSPVAAAASRAAPATSPLGRPRPVKYAVAITVNAKSSGPLEGLFCQQKIDLSGGALPPQLPPAPFLVTLSGASEGAVDGLVALLKKKLGDDVSKVAVEIHDRSGGYETFNRIAKRIKTLEPRILVGGAGECAIHDRAALRDFNVKAAPADFVSGNFYNGSGFTHQKYTQGDTLLFGNSKIQYDTVFDIGAQIAGRIDYPPNRKLALTGYAYKGKAIGDSPEERAYAATVVANFAVVNVQWAKRTEGRPTVLYPLPAAYAEAVKAGNELLWPKAHGGNGEPWDFAPRPEFNTMPVTGIATRDPATQTIHVIAVNNSTATVKATLSLPGKGAVDLYFDPCEVKVLRF